MTRSTQLMGFRSSYTRTTKREQLHHSGQTARVLRIRAVGVITDPQITLQTGLRHALVPSNFFTPLPRPRLSLHPFPSNFSA